MRRLQEVLDAQERPLEPWFKDGLLACLPNLRAFAISLTNDADRADDLVQETVLRALANRSSFQDGTNLRAWLFTILRNAYHTLHRKTAREIEDADGTYADRLRTAPDQLDRLHIQELRAALERLSVEQREALLLVGAEGVSYEDAALICGCAMGTIKSRVSRARQRLAELLGYSEDDFAGDAIIQAAMNDEG